MNHENRRTPITGRRTIVRWIGGLLVSALLLLPAAALRADGGVREYAIKAAYLYNFPKFVDWPAQALPESSPNITVAVLGHVATPGVFRVLNGKTVKGKTVVVRQISSVQEATNSQILFVTASEKDRTREILDAVRNSSILTVGEVPGFARAGGVINFKVDGNRVRFEINPAAAERAHLNISSQLLKLADLVRN